MAQNFFEELHNKKQYLLQLAEKATEYGWIDENHKREIVEKLENDTLTIGVIGQMKCGKSTFLNSFVFEDNVLPAATTPMTAALSVITYGQEKKIVAEFYNRDEWEEQKMQASRSLDDVAGNTLEESKVKAAQDLVKRSVSLGNELDNYLGKTKEDSFENLIEYVGAEGKYISITKSVKIYYPKDYLKGVEIVDTPGFNDPIVSREERTKDFLRRADVVLMMLYAGRPFDATDRDIIFKNVRECGIGKVIIGINKYDLPYCNGETEVEIKDYVKAEIRKACRECDDETLVNILKDVEPIPLSAEMALLSQLPMSKITSNDAFAASWNRICNDFEISSQLQFREKSHMDDLAKAIKTLVETEKGEILFAKPLNAIFAAANTKKSSIDKEIRECEMLISDLGKPDYELEEKQEGLEKAERRLNKKINSLGEDLDFEFNNIVRNGQNELEDLVDASCRKMRGFVEAKGRFANAETIVAQIKDECVNLDTRIIKRAVENKSDEARKKIKACVTDCLCSVEDILIRNFEDFDSRDFIKNIENHIGFEISNKDLFALEDSSDEVNYGWSDVFCEFINGATFGMTELLGNFVVHNNEKNRLNELITNISGTFDPIPYLSHIYEQKDKIISIVQKAVIDEFITPMKEQIFEIRSQKMDKEKTINATTEKLTQLKLDKKAIEEQLVEVNNYNLK